MTEKVERAEEQRFRRITTNYNRAVVNNELIKAWFSIKAQMVGCKNVGQSWVAPGLVKAWMDRTERLMLESLADDGGPVTEENVADGLGDGAACGPMGSAVSRQDFMEWARSHGWLLVGIDTIVANEVWLYHYLLPSGFVQIVRVRFFTEPREAFVFITTGGSEGP